jgi:hypothetical protein
MIDDVQDNLFFNDLVEQENMNVEVFVIKDKTFGAIGL